jgi:hypothetical protein
MPVHVSSNKCSSSGGSTCINTSSGITRSRSEERRVGKDETTNSRQMEEQIEESSRAKKKANGKQTTKNKPFILTDKILKTLKSFLYTEI